MIDPPITQFDIGMILIGLGFLGIILAALIISIEEDTVERKYGNGKETQRRD